MPARLIAHLPDDAAPVRVLEDGVVATLGRDADCTLRIAHPSVSRRHATLAFDDGGWRVRDLGSKNGTFVDGLRVGDARLPGAAWLRLGDVYCEFTPMDAAQAAAAAERTALRRSRATALTVRLQQSGAYGDLLRHSLLAAIELAQCERGFVLLRHEDGLHVQAAHGLGHEAIRAPSFSGSVGAVRRALEERRTVIVNDIAAAAWLASRQSVAASGLGALAVLPLLDRDESIGAIYVDRRDPGTGITDIDRELLEAFAERAALCILARRAIESPLPPDAPRWSDLLAAGSPPPR